MLQYHDTCCALIKQINDGIEKKANNAMRDRGMTLIQMAVLIELDNSEDNVQPLKWLEHKFKVAQPTMLGIVKRLEQKELVETFVCSEDRRMKMVRMTDAGKARCNLGYADMEETEDSIRNALTESELTAFLAMLKKIQAQMA